MSRPLDYCKILQYIGWYVFIIVTAVNQSLSRFVQKIVIISCGVTAEGNFGNSKVGNQRKNARILIQNFLPEYQHYFTILIILTEILL